MKNYVLFTLLLIGCNTQKYTPAPPELLEYRYEINVVANQNPLYIAANEWLVNTFVNAESVLEFSDKEGGIIIGKYVSTHSFPVSYGGVDVMIKTVIKIKVSENKAVITFSKPSQYYSSDPIKSIEAIAVIRPTWENLGFSLEKFLHENLN